MNLRELRAAYPHRFHHNQDWFADERFMDSPNVRLANCRPPVRVISPDDPNATGYPRHPAVYLAGCFIADEPPGKWLWRRRLYTSDYDRFGQQVYLTVTDGRLEIHRHLHATEQFGVAVWR